MDDYLRYVAQDPKCAAALILLDLDDGCPCRAAHDLADTLRTHQLRFPVALVFAHREYEAWFLASIRPISFKPAITEPAVTWPGDPEGRRDAKGWISGQMGVGQRREAAAPRRVTAPNSAA